MKNKLIVTLCFTVLFFISCGSSQSELPDGLYAKMLTNKGEILLKLTYEETPVTVGNFVSLSEGTNKSVSQEFKKKKYYDGLVFHRVIENFMIQGGDPQGTGQGGPGYKFKDEFDEKLKHDGPGILSMANAGPKTNGSQFFITHKETPWLDGVHSVFGKVIEGMDVVNLIEQNDTIKNISIVRVGREAKSFKASKVFANHFKDDEKEEERKQKKITELKLSKLKQHEKIKIDATQTDSGLKYFKTNNSIGEKVDPKRTIMAHYAVYFNDGSLLDTSIFEVAEEYDSVNVRRKQSGGYSPLECRIGPEDPMIPGFKEGLSLLSIGDKATLFIPYYLAYGETGRGNAIPPKSDLIFEVEIVEMK